MPKRNKKAPLVTIQLHAVIGASEQSEVDVIMERIRRFVTACYQGKVDALSRNPYMDATVDLTLHPSVLATDPSEGALALLSGGPNAADDIEVKVTAESVAELPREG